ncbi:MAG: CheR family methyltransferase [Pseudomonadota bacterium]
MGQAIRIESPGAEPVLACAQAVDITPAQFGRFRNWLHEVAGIALAEHKKSLLMGRLGRRLPACGVADYGAYFDLLMSGQMPGEVQVAIDLLTTNETYFFREPAHFDFLREQVLPGLSAGAVKVWSAASSSGEEAYTLCMVLAETLGMGRSWEVFGSDLSSRVLETAARAHYPMTRAERIPRELLHRHCLKGTGRQAGTFLVDRSLRARTRFGQINLIEPLPDIGPFDIVFLRNVMIYFDLPTKREVVSRVLGRMRPGGWLFVSHSETLNGVSAALDMVRPSIYRLRGSAR